MNAKRDVSILTREESPATGTLRPVLVGIDGRAIRLNPELNLIGAMLRTPVDVVKPLLELLHDSDLQDWRARTVLTLIRFLASHDKSLNPAAVSATAHSTGYNGEVLDQIDQYTREVFRNVVAPGNVRYYANRVVETAYRRDFGSGGVRLAQMAEAWVDIEELEECAFTLIRQWHETSQRVRALASG